MTGRLPNIDHVGIVVRDVDASVAWYRTYLGFEPRGEYGFPGARVAFIGRDGLRLELFQVDGAAPMAPAREQPQTNLKIGGVNHLALATDDLDALLSTLEAQGVEVVSPPRDMANGSGDRFAFVHDNERMLIEFVQPAPRPSVGGG